MNSKEKRDQASREDKARSILRFITKNTAMFAILCALIEKADRVIISN